MDNYTFFQKLLLLNSISVVVVIIITITHENKKTFALLATLIMQISYLAISILNWLF